MEQPFTVEPEGLVALPTEGAPATIRAYVPAFDLAAAEAAIEETRTRLGHLTAFGLRPIGELRVRTVHEEDWAEAWKAHFPVMRLGRRIVIKPTWREFEPGPADVVVALDPGMAFGTGLHPTTRLCLSGLERWADAGLVDAATVLDVGCGSGILGVAAGLLGAGSLRAVDTDPIAVEATRENAARNRVGVEVTVGSLPVAGGPWDLVLANLVASLLVALAPELAAALKPGDDQPGTAADARGAVAGGVGTVGGTQRPGRLLASGIFIEREAEVVAAFESVGLRVVGREQETDWVALDLERAPLAMPAVEVPGQP